MLGPVGRLNEIPNAAHWRFPQKRMLFVLREDVNAFVPPMRPATQSFWHWARFLPNHLATKEETEVAHSHDDAVRYSEQIAVLQPANIVAYERTSPASLLCVCGVGRLQTVPVFS